MNPIVNVLIVTDDQPAAKGGFLQWADQAPADQKGPNNRAFHLGEFVKVLTETHWLGFDVHLVKAHRSTAAPGQTDAQFKAERGCDVSGFKFNQPFTVGGQSKTLSDFDIILFFSVTYDTYGLSDADLQAEAGVIAQFMEDGGGFFATGDHENLGGAICRFIPRVRSMRRWYFPDPGPNGEPAAPSGFDSDRHDTTQPGADHAIVFEDQSDDISQPIDPRLYGGWLGVSGGYPAHYSLPHPLLCSPDGLVNRLPDHMHEGTVEVPADLSRSFPLGAGTAREYPDLNGQPLAPDLVAEGRVLGGHPTPSLDPGGPHDDPFPTTAQTFGVICAWDGHLVGKGRVAVDSTWHHFFNINLTGDLFQTGVVPASDQRLHGFYVSDGMGGRVPNGDYRLIQWYYRNLIYWLIPADRHQIIWWKALVDLTRTARLAEELTPSRFGRFDIEDSKRLGTAVSVRDFRTCWYYGQLAEAYLRQARGACAVVHIWVILYKPKIPWWEWIQEVGDPWTPVQQRGVGPGEQFNRAAAYGFAPRLDSFLRAGLGLAVMIAAQARGADAREDPAKLAKRLDAAFGQALKSLDSGFRDQVAQGVEMTQKLLGATKR